ncbi:MAG: alpha/beta fold hydrolase [Gammaproteobacteria bacterium]|jgi:hypothetical protein|nr:alpha/beta fold hydrolase [Gammaproteobacteria bacterium]
MASVYCSALLNWYQSPLGAYLQGGEGAEHILLAHGAGIGMRHDFMQRQAEALINEGFTVSLFDYAYMQTMHASGRRRPPARVPQLLQEHRQWLALLAQDRPVWLMGKSMGGRIASMLAQEALPQQVKGWCALGYPFHPPNKPQQLRVSHLLANCRPGLVIQGDRDAMGKPEIVASLPLPGSIKVQWLAHMDHGYNPYKQALLTQYQAIVQSAKWFKQWVY